MAANGDNLGKNWLKVLDSGQGQIDRLATLTDGVFAVAMTLLVIEIHPPADWDGTIYGLGRDLFVAIAAYATTFLIVVTMWIQLRRILALLKSIDGMATGLVLFNLAMIGLVPSAVKLQLFYQAQATSLLIYGGVVIALTAASTLLWIYAAVLAGLVKDEVPVQYRQGYAVMQVLTLASGVCALNSVLSPEWTLVQDQVNLPWLAGACVLLLGSLRARKSSLSTST